MLRNVLQVTIKGNVCATIALFISYLSILVTKIKSACNNGILYPLGEPLDTLGYIGQELRT